MALSLWSDPFFDLFDPWSGDVFRGGRRKNLPMLGGTTTGGDITRFGSQLDWWPTLDVTETDNEWKIQLEIPGVPKENIKVECDNAGNLVISGEKKPREERRGHQVSSHRTFVRQVREEAGVA